MKQILSLLNSFIENPKSIEPVLNFTAEKKEQSASAKTEIPKQEVKKEETKIQEEIKPETKTEAEQEKSSEENLEEENKITSENPSEEDFSHNTSY